MGRKRRLRILFVARPASVHAARWINQIADEGWDLHLFPAYEAPPHTDFRNLTAYGMMPYRVPAGAGLRQRALWPLRAGGEHVRVLAYRLPPRLSSRAAWLARVVALLKPDLVNSL